MTGEEAYGAVVALVLLCIYFVPTIVASSRKHADQNAILVLNLFLGWTFVGWVIALVWAVKNGAPNNL